MKFGIKKLSLKSKIIFVIFTIFIIFSIVLGFKFRKSKEDYNKRQEIIKEEIKAKMEKEGLVSSFDLIQSLESDIVNSKEKYNEKKFIITTFVNEVDISSQEIKIVGSSDLNENNTEKIFFLFNSSELDNITKFKERNDSKANIEGIIHIESDKIVVTESKLVDNKSNLDKKKAEVNSKTSNKIQFEINASELSKSYLEVGDQYESLFGTLNGEVLSIDKEAGKNKIIIFKGTIDVVCIFAEGQDDKINKLKIGDKISVDGLVESKTSTINIVDAIFRSGVK
ncbi:hypothetical protein JCM1393_19640 [Clostridium carnis]